MWNGRPLMVEWLLQPGCPWRSDAFEAAASHGHLEILQSLRTQSDSAAKGHWDLNASYVAAASGHLAVPSRRESRSVGSLNLCQTCGSSWTPGDTQVSSSEWLSLGHHVYAAIYGHLEILRYLHDHDCPWDQQQVHYYATDYGHLKVLEYLETLGVTPHSPPIAPLWE